MVQNYIDPSLEEFDESYAWQASIFQISAPELQKPIYDIILSVPVNEWPLFVQKLVFPLVYGFETNAELWNIFKENKEDLLDEFSTVMAKNYEEADY